MRMICPTTDRYQTFRLFQRFLNELPICKWAVICRTTDCFQEKQSAYRKFHSTETALLDIMSDVHSAADRGQVTLLALLDQSAAFDVIDHGILMDRLHHTFGFSGTALSWIGSYLSGRSQYVYFNGDSLKNYTSRVRSASRFCARTTSFRAFHRRYNLYGGGTWTEGSFLRRRPSNLLPRGSVRRSITCSSNFFLRRVDSTMDGSKSTETQSNKNGVDLARFASTNSTMLYSSSVDSWGADSAFIPRSRSWSYLR